MTSLAPLIAELDRWLAAGRQAAFWWRDDDAAKATPALERLLALRAQLGVPLAIAAVPAMVDSSLAEALDGNRDIAVLQHGWAHRNHALPGRPKIELGGERTGWAIASELAQGRARLTDQVGDMLLPVIVPPWNRIDKKVLPILPGLGYDAISIWKARPRREAVPGLLAVNTHIDIIDWTGDRGFVGDGAAVEAAAQHLAARRTGAADADEPTGLLTHHLAHDEDCWDFVAPFVAAISAHPAARWLHPRAVFAATPANVQ